MSTAAGGDELVPAPASGRVFTTGRRVRLGDASPAGRLRLDALARYAQDVAHDDSADSGLPHADAWVVRRTALEVHRFPVYDEPLVVRTWCSGVGPRWADRRTQLTGASGGHVEMVSLWVAVDATTGRPRSLGADFAELYGASAAGRTVSPRLTHAAVPAGRTGEPWPWRFTDFDVLGHVNNAAYWEPVEELLAERRRLRAPLRAELEHVRAVEPGTATRLVPADDDGDGRSAALWLVGDEGTVRASAVLRMTA